jgi:hypothetical protein
MVADSIVFWVHSEAKHHGEYRVAHLMVARKQSEEDRKGQGKFKPPVTHL